MATPMILVMAGPNGAGKSTCSMTYLEPGMAYLNADEVAKTLPGYPSPAADLEAGRIVPDRMAEFESRGEGFAFETTLATRALASRVKRLRQSGYAFHLVYVWSPSVAFSMMRVAARVRAGGHDIPADTIRRRYAAGLANFFQLYRPLADRWEVVDNTHGDAETVAEGCSIETTLIHLPQLWDQIRGGYES